MSITKQTPWIGIDLDGTLAHYTSWRGADHIGTPLEPMVERVRALMAAGFSIRIFTARVGAEDPKEAWTAHTAIEEWCKTHLGCVLPITNRKDPAMLYCYDDRAMQCIRNRGCTLAEDFFILLKEYNQNQLTRENFLDAAFVLVNKARESRTL